MLVEVKIPTFAESISEGTLGDWLKQPGDAVEQGDNLIEVETDKVVLEVAAPGDGVLKELKKDASETVVSEEVIAVIDTDGKAAASAPAPKPVVAQLPTEKAKTVQLSPAVRKLLTEHELDAANIPAAKSGRVTKADVLSYLESQPARFREQRPGVKPELPPAPAAEGERLERRVPMTRLRKRVAERLLAAQREHAILTTFNEVNMQPVMALRKRYRDKFEEVHGTRLGFMSLFVLAAVEALKRFPEVNASIDGDDIVYHGYFDIGIAVSSPRGLVVPILRDADQRSVAEIETSVAGFGQKAQDNQLTVEDLTGGTFTITNGGVFGSLLSTPILNPPQSAILGMHKIQQRPMAEDGQVIIRPMMYLALSYDHRIIDGREAVRFLITIKEQIEDPNRLLLQI